MPPAKQDIADTALEELVQTALRSGASAAAPISASEISVEHNLADLCKNSPCENFGLSPSCPPHVAGPDGFRSLLKDFDRAVVIKIDVPLAVLLSDERREVMQLLHEVVADVERSAVKMGFVSSRAFAGGSCKQIFCRDHPDCRVLKEGGACRNPQHARPSMSGFGINVTKLMKTAGFDGDMNSMDADVDDTAMSWVSGLVLIG